jgi:hypothetical protein
MSDRPLLTDDEITILNLARRVLIDVRDRLGYKESFGIGRVSFAADHAESAIFQFLNNTHVWAGVPMTDLQLHGRPPADAPEPQSLRA